MNGYLAQCKDTATIPFVNGKFIGDMQSFRVFCHDDNPSWSIVNYDNTSLSYYGSAECKNDVLGDSLSEVKCIDAITAITDGETVTFFNIPPVFTKVKVIVESQNHSYQVQRKLRSNTRENTWTVPAKSLTYSGNAAVAPRKRFQILFYERKKQKPGTAETQFVTIKAAPEYNYVPQAHPQILGELVWIILVLAILSAIMYGVYRMFKRSGD